MKLTKPHPLLQSSALVLLGAIAAVVVTLVCYRLQAGGLPPAMLYVFVVVMVSLRGNLVASIWVSLLAVASLDYFFTSPQWAAFPIRQLRDVLALIGLLSTALVINRLIVRMRQSFKEMEAAREQLRMVIDTVPILLTSTRPDGAVEFVNQQWRDFLGLSLEEFQRGWAGALHPDDQNRFLAEWRAALESGVPLESEARMRRADGQYRWLLIRVVPSRDRQGHIVRWYGTSADIEDRKRAEERARQADRERRVIIDTIPALLWSTLPDGSSDFNNQRWLEYSGLSADQAAGWGYIDVLHPEDYERRTPLWRAAFAAGESMEDEARLRRADGQYRWFLHRAVPLRDEGGKILKWLGTSTDIEDLKRAEGVLREQAGLLDLSHDTVFVRDMSDVITYWNRGAEALYGWSRDEAIGHASHRLTQTIFPAPLEQINEELLRTGRWEGELVHTKRDGSRVVVASRWSIQRDELGRPAAILETNNDVTQRKRAEEELRRSEAYLAEAQRLSHTGSWAWNLQRPEESYWSPEAYRIFGLNPDRGAAPSLEEFRACIHPDDLSRVEEARTQAIRDKTNFEVDYRAVLPDGSKRYLHAVGRPIVSPAGEVVELVGTVIDSTERKRAERALRRARERALGPGSPPCWTSAPGWHATSTTRCCKGSRGSR
jgi:PAS domain S-box-containing protein